MANSEEPVKHYILNYETSDFCRRFSTRSVEINSLSNTRWSLVFYPKGPNNTDNYAWCELVRSPGGSYYALRVQFKFQLIFLSSGVYETEYITHTFADLSGRSIYKTSITSNMLTAYRDEGCEKMIFRCFIKDERPFGPNTQTWFYLASLT